MDTRKLKITKDWGITTFELQPGTRVVQVDTRITNKKAIVEFLDAVDAHVPDLTGFQRQRLLAVAIGLFGVELNMIYDEEFSFERLSDTALADIIRYKMMKNEIKL